MLAVGGCHLRDAMSRAVEIVLAILIRHHGVVYHRSRVAKLADLYEAAINKVKEANDQAVHDFLARRLYNMTGDIVMSLLILDDATKSPELFAKSANVYVRMAEEEVLGHSAYIQNFQAEDLESFKA